MKRTLLICVVVGLAVAAAGQVSSHAPTAVAAAAPTAPMASAQTSPLVVTDKAVAKVNGVALTDRDLLREMYAIFPYAQQHNGFPKAQEAAIRQGALEMIIFEELVYQDAERRKLAVPVEKMKRAEAEFKKQFKSPDEYQQYMQAEMGGSEKRLREQMRRSMLIEQVMKSDVELKATVTPAEVQAYYVKNAAKYTQQESYNFQSISVMPPLKPTAEQAKQAQKKAEDALKQAKATKSYQDFGLLAEKISDDDFRVNMGDHKAIARDTLPPQIVKAFAGLQAGQVSGLIQIESAYTIVRLNAHNPGRKKPLAEVKGDIKTELQKMKYEKLRSGLAKQLRSKAKVEVV
jgi:parvulin-like peptidyl-prolyl isomerase